MDQPLKITRFKRLTRSTYVLAIVFSNHMPKPNRCKHCTQLRVFGDASKCPVEDDQHYLCRKHIKEWLEEVVNDCPEIH